MAAGPPATDAALAMSMGHVILKEFVERNTPYFTDYVKKYTDLPFLVALDRARRPAGPRKVPHRSDPGGEHADTEAAVSKPVLPSTSTAPRWCPMGPWAIASPPPVKGNGTWTCRGRPLPHAARWRQ